MNNILGDYETKDQNQPTRENENKDEKNPNQGFGMSGQGGHSFLPYTKGSLAESKTEIYEFMNLKISEIHQTYSTKIEMLSNFMMQAQDEVRELQSIKNDHSLKYEDIKTFVEGRDK